MDSINNIKNIINNEYFQENKTTKKNKDKIKDKSNKDLTKIWNQFDQEINNKKLECVYLNNSDKYVVNYEICSQCKTNLFIGEDGFLCCPNKKCGIIYKDNLDQSAEWRFYGADDNNGSDPTRCGLPINPLLQESSYSCKVLCPLKSTYEMHKIKRYTDWQSMPYKEKSRYDEFQLITIISQNAGIPKMIIDDATRFHKKISEIKTFRGLNRDGIIAASIYISCRVNNYPRTAKEIADIFNLDNTSATKGCKNAVQILNTFESQLDDSQKTKFCKTKPVSFIERYCSKLNVNNELTKVCKFVAIRIDRNNLIPENTPQSIAAGIIYFIAQVCNLAVSKKDVNNVSGTSEVTINKCYKKLDNMRRELIPSAILDKYS